MEKPRNARATIDPATTEPTGGTQREKHQSAAERTFARLLADVQRHKAAAQVA